MADVVISAQVVGVKEMFALLKTTDKKLVRQTQAAMRTAASPLVAQARSITPAVAPLSGWAHNGRVGWKQSDVMSGLKVSIGGARVGTTWPLLRLVQKSAAGQIYDLAGRGNYTGRESKSKAYSGRPNGHRLNGQGRAMVANLPNLGYIKGSKYSRVVFPAFVASRRDVTAALLEALDKVAADMNHEIERI